MYRSARSVALTSLSSGDAAERGRYGILYEKHVHLARSIVLGWA